MTVMHRILFPTAQNIHWIPKHGRSCLPHIGAQLEHNKRLKLIVKNDKKQPLASTILNIEQGYDKADPLCDAWALDAEKLKLHPIKTVMQALTVGIDSIENAPESLKLIIDQLQKLPQWIDFELMDIGATAINRYPVLTEYVLKNVALMVGYSIPGLIEPLIRTGNLIEGVVGRSHRTGNFVIDVNTPSAMQHGGVGFMAAINTRLIHTMVRKNLLAKKESNGLSTWDVAYWGKPINQSDMTATLMQFSCTIINALQFLGARLTAREKQGLIMLWNYAGYLMGIDEDSLMFDLAESNRWSYAYSIIQKLNIKDAIPLARALDLLPITLKLPHQHKRTAQLDRYLRTCVTRLSAGDAISDALGLQRTPLKWLFLLGLAPTVYINDVARQKIPFWDNVLKTRRDKMLIYGQALYLHTMQQQTLSTHRAKK